MINVEYNQTKKSVLRINTVRIITYPEVGYGVL
jgi:hypothetical protein